MIDSILRPHIERAAQIAGRSKHEYVLPEHLIFSILTHDLNPDVAASIKACKAKPEQAAEALGIYLTQRIPTVAATEDGNVPFPKASQAFTKIAESSMNAGLFQQHPALISDVWVSFLDSGGEGAQLLAKLNITAFHVKRFLKDGTLPPPLPLDVYPEASALEPYATCLTQLACTNRLEPVVGRDALISELCLDLQRRRKANLLLVGEPGVGKTAVVEGLAHFLVSDKAPESLKNVHLWMLRLPEFVSNTSLRGEFEERVKQLLEVTKKYPHVILFIDEVHQLIGLGKGAGSSDAANLFKPALARNELRLIGATTHAESQRIFEKDKALQRRFVRRDVKEPTADVAVQMVQSSLAALAKHHDVSFQDDVAHTAVDLAAKHIRHARLPDSALDVLDYFGSRHRHVAEPLTSAQLVACTAQFLSLPLKTLQPESPLRLKSFLNQTVFGQMQAVDSVYKHVVRAQAGLQHPNRPLGAFLFAGPTGVGKTEMANQLAVGLNLPLVRIDLSEYSEPHSSGRLIGAPPSYVGYEDGGQLSKAMHQHSSCVLLLDEAEKAHPNVIQLFLQAMDYGTLTDSQGDVMNFRHSFLIFTTNLGAEILSKKTIGFTTSPEPASFDASAAIRSHFTPEFRNRLSSVISFQPLSLDVQVQVVEKLLNQTRERMQNATLSWSKDFCVAVAKNAFDSLLGARPLERWIDDRVSTPVAELWLEHQSISSAPLSFTLLWNDETKMVVVTSQKNGKKSTRKSLSQEVIPSNLKSGDLYAG